MPERCAFYHVHSLAPVPARSATCWAPASTELPFVTAVQRSSFYGVQFHPEKSSAAGLRLLANFARICAGAPIVPVRLYPAIDILDGNAVRLVKGDFDAKQTYDGDPLSAALGWVKQGAQALHVVDLDGARPGSPSTSSTCVGSRPRPGCPSSTAAGCAPLGPSATALAAGATRVILGTAALTDPEMLREVLAAHGPERILVGVDVRGGYVATHGGLDRD